MREKITAVVLGYVAAEARPFILRRLPDEFRTITSLVRFP